jgi:hypothetical protein
MSNFNNDYEYDQQDEKRRKRRHMKRRRVIFERAFFFLILILILLVAAFLAFLLTDGFGTGATLRSLPFLSSGQNQTVTVQSETSAAQTDADAAATAPASDTSDDAIAPDTTDDLSSDDSDLRETLASEPEAATVSVDSSVLEQAELLAMGYDYDAAIELLQSIPSYENSTEITSAISRYEEAKASCVAVDVTTVPHIFYHSLINDTDRAFNVEVLGQSGVDGMNAWMTTVEEFDQITQTMYEEGYVFVRLRDLVVESTDEDGNVTFTPNTELMLPPDKKAVVLSVDDLSYYHSYEAAGYPDKLVLDENGDVKCHYVTADGTEEIGDFDVVPRLNSFLEEHPDGAYRGARGLIALTGYNGVFGYRTDADYELQEHLMSDQKQWLDEHPDFDRQEEIEQATVIADALRDEGWEFASHTWGHLSVTQKTVEELKTDNEKWIANVQNIVGPVDTIVFAHGNDLGDWQDYTSDNEKYAYYKSVGYNFFCNVDSSTPYWVQIRSDYVRQGRIDLDGYQLYQSSIGATTVLDGFFLASQIFDSRRPTPVVANGES